MPTKYVDRLNCPVTGNNDARFYTRNGLSIATGYERVVMDLKPLVEFSEGMMNKENIFIPENQKWRVSHPGSPYIEYRSRDYCNIKIMRWKETSELLAGMFYISPFDLKSDQWPVLIDPLRRKRTLQSA